MTVHDSARPLRQVVPAIIMLGAGCLGSQVLNSSSPPFSPAYMHPGADGHPELTLFLATAPATKVPLPPGLSSSLTISSFDPDGTAIYVQDSNPGALDGIRKIEFKPARQSILPGTTGLGAIWHLTVSRPSGSIFVSGIASRLRGSECGTFKLNQDAEKPAKMLAGSFPECGGGGGDVSPDGKQVLGYAQGDLCLIDLADGAIHAIQGIKGLTRDDLTWKGEVAWSPDGQWIVAALDHRRTILIDAKMPSRQKSLGTPGNGRVVWSPDSKHLLLLASQGRCTPSLGYFESLETLNVETGERRVVKNSQCKVAGGWIGWIDPQAVQ